jgi:hypothetical protein
VPKQGTDGIGRLPTHHIVRVAVHRPVTVGHRQRLTQGVDGQHILRRTATSPGGGVRVADLLDQVVGVQAGTARRGDAINPFGDLLAAAGVQHHPHRVGPAGDRGRPGVAGTTVGNEIHHPG